MLLPMSTLFVANLSPRGAQFARVRLLASRPNVPDLGGVGLRKDVGEAMKTQYPVHFVAVNGTNRTGYRDLRQGEA